MSFYKKLALATKEITVEGSTVLVREMSMAEVSRWEYLRRFAPDDAVRMLFRNCVLEIDGQRPTKEQYEEIAQASPVIGLPIVTAVREMSEAADDSNKEADLKKD